MDRINLFRRIIFVALGFVTFSCGMRLGGDALRIQTDVRIGSGYYLYTASRMEDYVSVVELDDEGKPTLVQTIESGGTPEGMALFDERYLYVSSFDDGRIDIYKIDSRNGELEVDSSYNEGQSIGRLILHPSLDILYAFAYNAAISERSIITFEVDSSDGSLRKVQELTNTATGSSLALVLGVNFTPNEKFLVAASYDSSAGHVYEVNPLDGTLTFRENALIGVNPYDVYFPSNTLGLSVSHDVLDLLGASVDPVGWFDFTDDGSTWMTDWDFLSDWVTTENDPSGIFPTPDGQYLIIPNAGVDTIGVFTFDESALPAAPLTEIANSPYIIPDVETGDFPYEIVFHNEMQVLYIINYFGGNLQAYTYDFDSTELFAPYGEQIGTGSQTNMLKFLNLND